MKDRPMQERVGFYTSKVLMSAWCVVIPASPKLRKESNVEDMLIDRSSQDGRP